MPRATKRPKWSLSQWTFILLSCWMQEALQTKPLARPRRGKGRFAALSSSYFWLKKICDCQEELEKEISQYQEVAKKYRRVKAAFHTTSWFISVTTDLLSTGSFASVLTGVGIVVSVYLTGIAGLLGFMSATGKAASKKLIKKAEKHEKTVSLAEAKHRSICRLVSKACQGGSISDGEFASIMSEVKQYYDLKA